MNGLTNLPWYVYLIFLTMIIGFVVQKVVPVIKRAKETMRNYYKNPDGSTLSEIEQRALNVGAIFGEQTSCYIDTLETGAQPKRLRNLLRKWWEINNNNEAMETLHWLSEDGHRAFYNKIFPIISQESGVDWETTLKTSFQDEDQLKAVQFIRNLAETMPDLMQKDKIDAKSFDKGILAWDMGRLVIISRMCYDLQFISKDEAWNFINIAFNECQMNFKNWKELADSYIIGRAMWSGKDMALEGIKDIARNLLIDEKSPWQKYNLHNEPGV